MPKVFGVSLLAIPIAAFAMFFAGFVFYGLLFGDVWQAARGIELTDLEGQSGAWMAGGFLLELVSACGIAWVLKLRGSMGLMQGLTTALTLAILVAIPVTAYEFIYAPFHSVAGFLVDCGHRMVAFCMGGAVISLFRTHM